MSTLPRVVWVEEPKTGLMFEIGPSYGDLPTPSHFVTEGQFSCRVAEFVCCRMIALTIKRREISSGAPLAEMQSDGSVRRYPVAIVGA